MPSYFLYSHSKINLSTEICYMKLHAVSLEGKEQKLKS